MAGVRIGSLVMRVAVLWSCAALSARAATAACSDASTTAAMRECQDERYRKADADLNTVYIKLLQAQDSAGKRELRVAEAAWVRFRDANAAFRANAAAGGTLEPLLRVTSLADSTEARATELRKMLQ